MAAQMGGKISVNGELNGPLVPLAGGTAGDEMTVPGWSTMPVSIVDWPAVNGRPNVIKVADAFLHRAHPDGRHRDRPGVHDLA